MTATVLPRFTRKQVAQHTSETSCWVIHENRVFDVTEFLHDHPGGSEYILEYAGRSVTERMRQDHSDSAFALLDDYVIGELVPLEDEGRLAADGTEVRRLDSAIQLPANLAARGSSPLRARPVAPAAAAATPSYYDSHDPQDFPLAARKDAAFLDLKRPLLIQMWRKNYSKAYYMEQVHIPRYVPGSAPIFGGALELLTKTPWWVVPLMWTPLVMFCVFSALQGGLSPAVVAGCFAAGVSVWTLVEYGLHRFLFHLDEYLPDHRAALTLHFLLHGIHHMLPMDRMRLVLPPALFVILATPFWAFFHAICEAPLARALLAGGFMGYILYDCTHYYLHHGRVMTDYISDLKRYHMDHHYKDFDLGYGITSKFWDHVFGTVLV